MGGGGVLAALEALHGQMGDVFRLPLPGFNAVVAAGPEAARQVLVAQREDWLWRLPRDPVARLLRHGLLVEDGDAHDALRQIMAPALHRGLLADYLEEMWRCAREESAAWGDGRPVEMVRAMRRLTLRSLTACLFGADIGPRLDDLWGAVTRTLAFIGPGAWIVWPEAPRPGYGWARRRLDAYLHGLIAERRAAGHAGRRDLLSLLLRAGLDDDAIRDQLLTILVAGHDTNTALLGWALYRLARHGDIAARAAAEVAAALPGEGDETPSVETLSGLGYLSAVVKETLRLHPPIHAGNRRAARDLELLGYRVPAGTRLLLSYYLTHRRAADWLEPGRFDPERFMARGETAPRSAFAYLPYGGGPRFCLGAAFADLEARAVLAFILRRFRLAPAGGEVHAHMGATLEPRPGVWVEVTRSAAPRPASPGWPGSRGARW
jgi:cytochrome P450